MAASTLFACGTFILGGACGASLAHWRWIAASRTIRGQMAETLVSIPSENSGLPEPERTSRNSDRTIDLGAITTLIEQQDLEIIRLSAEIEALRTLIPLLQNHSEVARSYTA
jgi:hypothetical protein